MDIDLNNYLAVTIQGENISSKVIDITAAIAAVKCNILNIRMTRLGREFGLIIYIEGNWSSIAKLEKSLINLEKELNIFLHMHRTSPNKPSQKAMLYIVHVVTIDQDGILNNLLSFFVSRGISIEDISAHTYLANNGTLMVAMSISINISVNTHISSLREQFMHYCDKLNIDAGMEPLRD